jgi:hypothetical protein
MVLTLAIASKQDLEQDWSGMYVGTTQNHQINKAKLDN